MLRIKNGMVIEGDFDSMDNELATIVQNSSFTTIVIHTPIIDFEEKCIAVTSVLAGEGLEYGDKYVIARAKFLSKDHI